MPQSAPDEFKYWAFISYSHRDRKWCDWLHKGLESYRVPKRLIGRSSREGVVPARIFPVFRDREELPTSADLGEMIEQALAQSRYLIVICSSNAAQSQWVNAEIVHFKKIGRANRVLCIIVDGEPNATDKPDCPDPECFPQAVRFEVDDSGAMTDRRTEPIAADARPQGDGRADARLKVIAGILGVGFDELKQRELQRKQKRMLAITGTSLLIAIVTIGLAIIAFIARNEAEFQRGQAQAAQTEAEVQRDVAQQRFTNLCVIEGWRRADNGDTPGALLWFAEALRQQPESKPDELNHRTRLARLSSSLASLSSAYELDDFQTGLQLNADGSRMLIVDRAGSTQLLETATGAERAVLGGTGATFAGDDRIFVIDDDAVRALNSDGDLIDRWEFELPDPPLLGGVGLTVSDGGRIAAFLVGERIYIWRTDEPAPRESAVPYPGYGQVALSPSGSRMVIFDDEVILIDTASGGEVTRWSHTESRAGLDPRALPQDAAQFSTIDRIVFSPDEAVMLVAGRDGIAQLRRTDTGQPLGGPIVQGAWITAVTFSPNTPAVILGDMNGTVTAWNTQTGAPMATVTEHARQIQDVFFDRTGRIMCVVGAFIEVFTPQGITRITPIGPPTHVRFLEESDALLVVSTIADESGFRQLVQIWDLPAPPAPLVTLTHADAIDFITASRDGDRIISSSYDGTTKLWNADGELIADLSHGGKMITHASFTRDGDRFLTAGVDHTVRIWHAGDGTPTGTVLAHGTEIDDATFSRDGMRVLVRSGEIAAADPRAAVWDLTAPGAQSVELPISDADDAEIIQCAAFSPDGTLVVTGSFSLNRDRDTAQVWDAGTGQRVGAPLVHDQGVSAVSFSPDGTRIVTACNDNAARVWTLQGQLICATPTAPANGLESAVFSPDGLHILTASDDSSARIWNAQTGEPVAPAMRHSALVDRAAYSEDGRLILSTGSQGVGDPEPDQTARLWDARTGARIAPPFPHDSIADDAHLVADGTRLITASGNHVSIWDLTPITDDIDAVVRRGQVTSSRRIDAGGAEVLLSPVELRSGLDHLAPN